VRAQRRLALLPGEPYDSLVHGRSGRARQGAPQVGRLAGGHTADAEDHRGRPQERKREHLHRHGWLSDRLGRRRGSRWTPARRPGSALRHEVHELAWDDDRLAGLAAVQIGANALALARPRDELVLAQAGVDLEPVAHLAVHLDDELEGLAHELRL